MTADLATRAVEPVDARNIATLSAWAERLANSTLVPVGFRGRPNEIIVAAALGADVGLSPASSLQLIDVINGRPTMSGRLMLARIRGAGHRVRITGDQQSATVVVIRADDPEYEHVVSFTIEQARAMGLVTKSTWRSMTATMLKWRAVAEAARFVCPEVLFGVAYIPDELEDHTTRNGAQADAQQPQTVTVESIGRTNATSAGQTVPPVREDVVDVEEVHDETDRPITDRERGRVFAAFKDAGFTTDARSAEGRAARLAYINNVVQPETPIESTSDLTFGQAAVLWTALAADAAQLREIQESEPVDPPTGDQVADGGGWDDAVQPGLFP